MSFPKAQSRVGILAAPQWSGTLLILALLSFSPCLKAQTIHRQNSSSQEKIAVEDEDSKAPVVKEIKSTESKQDVQVEKKAKSKVVKNRRSQKEDVVIEKPVHENNTTVEIKPKELIIRSNETRSERPEGRVEEKDVIHGNGYNPNSGNVIEHHRVITSDHKPPLHGTISAEGKPYPGNHVEEKDIIRRHRDWMGSHTNYNYHQHQFPYERRHRAFDFQFSFDDHVRYHHWDWDWFPYNLMNYYPYQIVQVGNRLSVALLPFTTTEYGDEVEEFVAEDFQTALENLNRFQMIRPVQVQNVMDELQLYPEDLDNDRTAARVGRRLDADVVLTGNIEYSGDNVVIKLRLVDTSTGELITSRKVESANTDLDNLDKMLQYLSVLVYNDLPLVQGYVTAIRGDRVFLQLDSNYTLYRGTRVIVYRESKHLRNSNYKYNSRPDYQQLGELTIDSYGDKATVGVIVSKNGNIHVGDKIVLK